MLHCFLKAYDATLAGSMISPSLPLLLTINKLVKPSIAQSWHALGAINKERLAVIVHSEC